MKLTVARLRSMRGMVEQPKMRVPVPTGPKAKKGFMMVSSHDVEIYPLVFCVAVGFAIGAYSLIRHTMSNPDVNLSRDRRETPAWERYKPEEGKAYSQNRHHLANLKANPVNTTTESLKLQEGSD